MPLPAVRQAQVFGRVGKPLPISSELWLCHRPLTAADTGSETRAMATYVRASLAEVAAALAALTGEPHPLATTEGR